MIKADKKTFRLLYFLGFLVAFSTYLPTYADSSFLGKFIGIGAVGYLMSGASLVTIFLIFFYPRLIKKISNLTSTILMVVGYIISAFVLWWVPNVLAMMIFYGISFITSYLLFINMDVFVEDVTDSLHVGRTRTVYLTFVNLAVLLVPMVMGVLVKNEHYELSYLISGLIMILVLLILLFERRGLADTVKYRSRHFHQLLKALKGRSDITKVFRVSFSLSLFYVVMVLYVPFYMHNGVGFEWDTIGLIMTIALLPFVLFEFPAGILADKGMGERALMTVGVVLMVLSTGFLFFIKSQSFIMWAIPLLTSRMGAALVESMLETHFFKLVKKEEVDLINLFRDLSPLAWLVGPLISSVLLGFVTIPYLFIILAIVILLLALHPSLTLRKV